jgi:UDP-N-acetylmuramyl tripeptide synthase
VTVLDWKATAARAAGAASRLSGRGGTSLPGKVLLRLEPRAIARLSAGLRRTAIISATNGKTTTAAMVAAILQHGGAKLVHNRAGANMAGGIAGALLEDHGDTGLFEVDEFWLEQIGGQIEPDALLLANLFRDQLDRYGELEVIAERWQAYVDASPATRLVLNADDPAIADLGRERPETLFFGVQDDGVALASMQHASDAKHCRRCGAPYVYDAHYLGHLGRYHCDACGARRPEPQVVARAVRFDGVRATRFTLSGIGGDPAEIVLPLPGLYNVYNALGAAALALALGSPRDEIVAGLEAAAPAFGRAETVHMAGRDLSILLVKNPAGANEVLRTMILEDGQHDVLAVLNDNIADGRDVSWVWDADFELLAPRLRRVTCSGTRADELALRMKYAGVAPDRIVVVPELGSALDAALAAGAQDGARLFALPTYTAMLALREELVRRGVATGSFG